MSNLLVVINGNTVSAFPRSLHEWPLKVNITEHTPSDAVMEIDVLGESARTCTLGELRAWLAARETVPAPDFRESDLPFEATEIVQ